MTEIKIYSSSYKQEVSGLILHIQREEFGIPISLADQPDLDDINNFYQSGHGNFWIALAEGKVIGTIALLDIGNNQGALRKMFVASTYRGKHFNIGQKLLNSLLTWAKQKGFRQLFLGTTEKFLAAQRFYEKNGFIEVKKEGLPSTFPLMTVDVKFYALTLGL